MKAEKGEIRMNSTAIARTIARIAHAGQKYGAHDYFERHVMDVVRRVEDAENAMYVHVTIAYLHDVVEDTAVTLADLHELGFGDDVVTAVAAISRRDGEEYLNEYIPRVAENALAAFVKYHDLRSNTNTGTPESMARRNLKAMEMLK
jgi:(p)ppGpp synthase/HD superfamily hydrolase